MLYEVFILHLLMDHTGYSVKALLITKQDGMID